MLFNTFISVTASEIAQTEKFISQLQEQLETARQTLAALQQQQQLELTAKGAAESALETALKAYKAVFAAYGEEGVKEFQAALANLAVESDIPVLSLSASADEEPTEPENITPPPPSEPEVETEVTITLPVIEGENVMIEPQIEVQEEEEGESQPEKVDVTLPKLSAVREMRKDQVIRYLQTYNLPTDGVIKDLKSRLTAYIIQNRSVQKANSQGLALRSA